MPEHQENAPDPRDKLLHDAEAILHHAQEPTAPHRHWCEKHLKDALRQTYPYGVSATELGTRLGIPWARDLLKCLTLFGEVEKMPNGTYRYHAEERP